MNISVQCNVCKAYKEIEVPEAGYVAWKKGMLIQNAMPEVSIDDRELLISGTCGPCFENLFGPEED